MLAKEKEKDCPMSSKVLHSHPGRAHSLLPRGIATNRNIYRGQRHSKARPLLPKLLLEKGQSPAQQDRH